MKVVILVVACFCLLMCQVMGQYPGLNGYGQYGGVYGQGNMNPFYQRYGQGGQGYGQVYGQGYGQGYPQGYGLFGNPGYTGRYGNYVPGQVGYQAQSDDS